MNAAFQELMSIRQRFDNATAEITGGDPVLSTHFKIGETGAAVLAAIGVAVSDIWEMKTGRRQNVSIDARSAAAALKSFAYLQARQKDGSYQAFDFAASHLVALSVSQPFATKDGRWFLPHFGLDHLKERVLGVLGCEATPEAVARAISQWDALELEDAIDQARACGAMVRENSEWLAHPHGQALAARPVVEIEKIGESDPEPFPADGPALGATRVLDLTRILAGPVAARTCAEFGAEVLMVAARHAPQIETFVIDLSHGKRSCFLNLDLPQEAEQLRHLVRGADVFSQGYRPGVLAARGFGPGQLAALRPGLIYASIECFGQYGPLRHRAGWEQVAQAVTGLCHDSGGDRPALLPAAACDYTTGYLAAFGILLALARRAVEGGSYHVKVSLCQSGMFLYRQDKTGAPEADMDLAPAEVAALQIDSDSGYGPIRHLGPVLKLSETAPGWSCPAPMLGSDTAEWLT